MQCRVIHFTTREAAQRKADEINKSLAARATGNKAEVSWDGEDGYIVTQVIGC